MTLGIPIIQFDFASPEVEDIRRCLHALYSTAAGTQPLDRDFGLAIDFLDYPAAICKNQYALEVIAKTEKYEPRCKVLEVTYADSPMEQLLPTIRIGRRA